MKNRVARGSKPRPSSLKQRGFALVLALVFIVLGSLYGLVSQLSTVSAKAQRVQNTEQALLMAKEALLGYAATYRETHLDSGVAIQGYGYLPCPDTTTGDGSSNGCGTAGTTAIGLLPYKALGLPDLRDSEGNCLWYAISGAHKNTPQPAILQPLDWDTQGQFTVKDANGNTLQAPDDAQGGAVAIIFAPGASIGNQNRNMLSTPCSADPAQASAYLESIATPFTHGEKKNAAGNTISNDQLAWINVKEVFDRIRKRSDFATYLNSHIGSIQAALDNNLANNPPASGNKLPDNINAGLVIPSTDTINFMQQWHDQFRYFTCTSGSYCYTLGSQRCDGLLVFAGEDTSAQPRSSSQRANANYFESALAMVNGTSKTSTVLDNNYNTPATLAGRSQDLIRCLSAFNPQNIDTTNAAQFAKFTAVTSATQSIAQKYDATGRLELGATIGSSTSPLYGCIWYPEKQSLGALSSKVYLRAYFTFTVANRGDGFTFTIADADSTRNPTITMCGAGAELMGYAGNNGTTAPVNYPKIGIEFDRACNSSLGDTPCSTSYRQMAFVYWGDNATLNDDNTHGAGGSTSPRNPSSGSSGFHRTTTSSFLGTNTLQYVRLELERTYDSTSQQATHVLRAYQTTNPLGSGCLSGELSDLTKNIANMHSLCFASGPTISDTITIKAVAGASSAPMQQVWLGFTNGQGAQDQVINIYGLKVLITQ